MHEVRDLGISMATLSLCLSSKEKHHQGYQWQISFLYLLIEKEGWRENDKYENLSYLIYTFFSSINWFLAPVSTATLSLICNSHPFCDHKGEN